ncbi:unnamed protein product [Acanthosepion pharaonis]|uniref:Uncharacterized protein n=1 Tax=Acanthosepion pharaonis TaxID=158019 RepID=A0A812EST2_ACAPH|nr:unnamed protein product [Sepia pharaonis]
MIINEGISPPQGCCFHFLLFSDNLICPRFHIIRFHSPIVPLQPPFNSFNISILYFHYKICLPVFLFNFKMLGFLSFIISLQSLRCVQTSILQHFPFLRRHSHNIRRLRSPTNFHFSFLISPVVSFSILLYVLLLSFVLLSVLSFFRSIILCFIFFVPTSFVTILVSFCFLSPILCLSFAFFLQLLRVHSSLIVLFILSSSLFLFSFFYSSLHFASLCFPSRIFSFQSSIICHRFTIPPSSILTFFVSFCIVYFYSPIFRFQFFSHLNAFSHSFFPVFCPLPYTSDHLYILLSFAFILLIFLFFPVHGSLPPFHSLFYYSSYLFSYLLSPYFYHLFLFAYL